MNTRFNGVYSRDNLPKKLKDGTYVINFVEYTDVGTHWMALYLLNIEIIYFDSFGDEHVPKEIKEFIGHKNIKTSIFRIQANNSILLGCFCIELIDLMLSGKIWYIILVYFHLVILKRMII